MENCVVTDGKARGFLALPVPPAALNACASETTLRVAVERERDRVLVENAESDKPKSVLEGLRKQNKEG